VTGRTPHPLARAREISDRVLFPGALEVDVADVVPVERLDLLAAAGFYGLAGPSEDGGMGLADMATALEIIEILASGCLTTTFVWIQHHGAVRALADASPALRDAWLSRMCTGDVRAGVAFSGLRRPGPPILTAAPVWALVDATAGPTLKAEPLRLAAVNASATVTLSFDNHLVPPDRVISIQPFDEWQVADRASLRLNGSLALGVTRRRAALLDSASLAAELEECRWGLDAASPDAMPEQRARASELALRAATTVVVSGGGRAIALDHQAQRLAREALFLLVFGQTAAIKAAQLHRLYDESHG
jgi:alkylation response protein AidB-like acyl-CoA dehydrogenase